MTIHRSYHRLGLRRSLALAVLLAAAPATLLAQDPVDGGQPTVRTGQAAFGDWRADAPGVWRRITPADLPAPFASASASNTASIADPPSGAALKTLPGFTAKPFMTGLEAPRLLRTAPNGDIFVAESSSGRIRVLRTIDGAAKPAKIDTFVEGLDQPFGIAFYPAGPSPQWVYIANTDSVVRIPYRSGDLKARGPAETIVAKLTPGPGGHWTRDIAFSPDGSKMYVSVGSASNVADHMGDKTLADAEAYDAQHGLGAGWGPEAGRADVLTFTPLGGPPQIYASGIRNCVALTPNPQTNDLWCAVNERDGLGDNLAPDYATRVKAGGFYGWPWYYMGGAEDPRLKGRRPDLAGKTLTPDVPIQSHSAPLGLAFYPLKQTGPAAFPAAFRGDAFVTLHGSWNRALRTGYKVVRLKLHDGVPTGAYEDFLTGFVINDHKVWGRPVGVTVAHDGSLLVSEDANGAIWRVAYTGPKS
jgi:glucose/arabinose dehydrogenase